MTNRDWICDLCLAPYQKNIWTFYCTQCDFDACKKCMIKSRYVTKFSLLYKSKSQNNNIKHIIDYSHHHKLIYCITSRNLNGITTWRCNQCFKIFDNGEWSFYCSLCDFDLCYDCYQDNYMN